MSVNGYYDEKEYPKIDPNKGWQNYAPLEIPNYYKAAFSIQPDSQNSWFAGFNKNGDTDPFHFLATKQALDNVQNIRREAVNKQIGNLIRGYGLDGLSGNLSKIKGIAEDAQTKAGAATTGTNKLTGLFNTYKGDQQKLWDQNKQSWTQNSQNWGQNSQKWDQWGNEFNAANKRIDANTNKGGMLSTLLGN
ncbi:MAG: hypothetical protein EOM15_10675, partial [Spirochaetia bacterium]|nr:hypothetical protein [Spirochaetia bacterium]